MKMNETILIEPKKGGNGNGNNGNGNGGNSIPEASPFAPILILILAIAALTFFRHGKTTDKKTDNKS